MFRFSIRELFLFTIMAAFAVGWWVERRAHVASHAHGEELRGALSVSKMNTEVYVNKINGTPISCGTIFPVEWDLAQRRVP